MSTALHPARALGEVHRDQVEDFLYYEAELLDAWNLDEWLTLFTADGRYVIPSNDDPDGDPAHDLVLLDDDITRLTARVERLNSRKAHREYPHSNTNHQVTNVRFGTAADGALPVTATFTVWRFRAGRSTYYVGRYYYQLAETEAGLRIRSKRAVLDMTSLRPAGDVAIIL